MSVLHPSRITRRLLKIASFGLAGLLAGLLTGCSSTTTAHLTYPHLDTDWQTSSTYASATATMPSHAAHITHPRPCYAEPCQLRTISSNSHRRTK